MNTVFIVHVDYRKGDGETLGPFSTREKALASFIGNRIWEKEFCNPEQGYWGHEEASYQVEERQIQ
jgi:hypothetical protein